MAGNNSADSEGIAAEAGEQTGEQNDFYKSGSEHSCGLQPIIRALSQTNI